MMSLETILFAPGWGVCPLNKTHLFVCIVQVIEIGTARLNPLAQPALWAQGHHGQRGRTGVD